MAFGLVDFASVGSVWKIFPLRPFRKTPNVSFDLVPYKFLQQTMGPVDSIDRVFHGHAATSPGPVGDVQRPWYMHPMQHDNLLVFAGERTTELYDPATHSVITFTVKPDKILRGSEVILDGPGVLTWPAGTFHRVSSGPEGSMSINFAIHKEGWNVDTNFSIYDLNLATGESRVIRVGKEDQEPLDD